MRIGAPQWPPSSRSGSPRYRLGNPEHHGVDDFIDRGLHRSQTSWDDYDTPELLRDLAENVWAELNRLVDDPDDAGALKAIDSLRADYQRLHDHSVAVALDHTNTREAAVRRMVRANTARHYEKQIAELEAGRGRSFVRRAADAATRRLGR